MNRKTVNVDTDQYTFEYQDITYPIHDINVHVEIHRGELIDELYHHFALEVQKRVRPGLFIHKGRPAQIKVESMFSEFLFLQYAYGYREDDPAIPCVPEGTTFCYDQLRSNLQILLERDKMPGNEIQDTLDDLIATMNLEQMCRQLIGKMYDYVRNPRTNMYAKVVSTEMNKFNTLIYISHPVYANNKKYLVLVNSNVYGKLRANFEKFKDNFPPIKFEVLVWCLYYRYQTLRSHNDQLAVLPSIKDDMKKKYGCDVELFGSGVNSYFSRFCSIYYDLEKYLGSVGSFYDFVPIRGCFSVNPPFDEKLMELASLRMLYFLDRAKEPLFFIYCIPVWDDKGKRFLYGDREMLYEGRPYRALQVLEDRPEYIADKKTLPKDMIPYMNFTTMKLSYSANTYFISLTNCADKIPDYDFV